VPHAARKLHEVESQEGEPHAAQAKLEARRGVEAQQHGSNADTRQACQEPKGPYTHHDPFACEERAVGKLHKCGHERGGPNGSLHFG